MLSGEKILVTGVTGMAPLPIAEFLSKENEVWGVARFSDSEKRARVEQMGITTHAMDLMEPDFSQLPDDFTYVLHWAYTRLPSGQFLPAIQVNGVAAGLVLQHCRKAKAALVVSAGTIYSPRNDDYYHAFKEEDDIGGAYAPWGPTSPVSKVSLEAVARFCSQGFGLRTTITRLNVVYGPLGGMPVDDMEAVVAGRTVHTFADPYPASPIHADDMCAQLEALLDAASAPATIVNWCGDEVVTQREWLAQAEALSGKKADISHNEVPTAAGGSVGDTTKRMAITGPCQRVLGDELAKLYRERHAS
jgi:nucleoside-diphosphate-sugar epimerase